MRCPVALVAVLALSGIGAADDPPSSDPAYASLRITIVGLGSDKGKVRVAVFDASERWLKDAAYAKILDIESRRCEWLLEDVPFGEYGIAVFHDENGNGKNDRNFLGIPSEPYGFSNKARAKFGPPKWEKARFSVNSPVAEVVVEVK